ncbi:PAS domain-containing protein [Salinigranum marinum]|uniref:PAS domain-containing protein n=1 Tax=Salinigranum marinum TaxID=1515595 RepID=UPI002989F577|nr:PAS domain-containing protein [Salinigranum marinum]
MRGPVDERDAPARVLCVGGEPAIEEALQSQFERDGDISIVSESRAEDVVERVASERVDCVVTASELPDRTGVDLVASIRERDETLPVLLFTDSGCDETARSAIRAGVSDYIPYEMPDDGVALLADRLRAQVRDVRERRHTRRLETRFRQTIERTTDAVYVVDRQWRIEYMNRAMAERVGRDPDAVVGNTLWEEFPEIVGTDLEDKYRTAMETGFPVSAEKRLGNPFDYWVRTRAFPDADGLTVFSREISSERDRQQELERHEAVLQSVHDAVFVVDDTLTVQFANAAAARALGRRTAARVEDESLGDLVEGMVSAADATEFTQAVKETRREIEGDGGATGLYDFDLRLRLDTQLDRRWYDVRLTPLESGEDQDVLVVARDVTDQHAIQQQLERERDRLREVQTVVADETLSSDERVESLLELGCETLDLDIGLVAAIEDDTYTVDGAYAPDAPIEPGDQFALSATYCDEVIRTDTVSSFVDAIDAGKGSHPAYQEFELEAYVGVPLTVDGERFGTLNFSSPSARDKPFDEFERTLVELMAELIGAELTRETRRIELERQSFLFERVQDLADIGIWEYDPAADDLYWSRGVRRIHGVEPSYEPTLTDGIEFYHPDDRDTITAAVERALETGNPYELDLRIVRADDDVRDVRAWGNPVVNNDSNTMLRGVMQDVTEQKRRERELRRARQQFETFTENVDQGFFLVPPDYSEVLFVNSAAEDLYGVSEHELRRNPEAWLDMIHPGDLDAMETDIERQMTGEADWPQVQQFRVRHPEHGTRWLRSRVYPIRDTDGRVVRLAGIAADITPFEKHRRKLERLQQYTSQLIDVSDAAEAARIGVDAAIDVVGVDFCRIQLQGLAQRAPNTPQDEATTRAVTTYERAAEAGPLSTFARNTSTGEATRKQTSPDGGTVDPAARETPLTIPLGTHGVIGVSEIDAADFDEIDTTVLELLAEALSGALSRAEGMALLRDRERALEAQNDHLEKFASIVSHDLRNPLGVANGYLELAEEMGEPAYFEKTASALDRMEALVDDLLTLSKAGTEIEDSTDCALCAVAHDAWSYVETKDAAVHIDDGLPTVEGDESLLTQLFENLFRNAVEHGPDDVSVTVEPLTDRQGFYVADDGPGIPPEKREEVFEYGYTSSPDGTGFGLAIVTDLAGAHGWSVDLAKSASGGVRFEFTPTERQRR